jgi:RNA polymerase sigma-70 factor (ECF subfamily)
MSVATPYDQVVHAADSRSLLRALDALGEEQRATFIMADLEGMTVPEIAAVLNVNLNTVYSRLRAARREVNRRLEAIREHDVD